MTVQKFSLSILFASSVFVLTACASTRPIPQLRTGSNVALISTLNDEVTYRYLGSTVYMNNESIFTIPGLRAQAPTFTMLEKNFASSGYHAIPIIIQHKNALARSGFHSNHLTGAEQAALSALTAGHNISRAIIFSKARNCDFNDSGNDALGYGYIQKDKRTFKRTYMFAAINIRVVDMPAMNVVDNIKICLSESTTNDTFISEHASVYEYSLCQLRNWLGKILVPEVKTTLRNDGVIH